METIQQFKSFCGKIFDSAKKCTEYEVISIEVNKILSTITDSNQYDDDCSFSNGKGYIQHPKDTYKVLETKLVELSNKWFKLDKPFTCFNYYLGRYIDDSNMSCLNKLSYKLMTINKQGREYGQPYYKLNPDKVTGGQLN